MRLDADLVRSVLLTIEEAPYDTVVQLVNLQNALPDYAAEDLNYTCLKLKEGGFIDANFASCLSKILPELVGIRCLTYAGHQFLENIRDEDQWGSVKKVLSSVRNYSLSAIGAAAEGITAAALNKLFNE